MKAASAFEAGMQYRITSFYCGQDNSPFCPVYKGGRRPLMGRSAATAAPAASLHCYSPYLPCLVAAHTHTHSAEGYCVAPFCAKSLRLTKKKKKYTAKERAARYGGTDLSSNYSRRSHLQKPGQFSADTLCFALLMSPSGCRGAVGRRGPAETTETASVSRGKAVWQQGY